jgi:hypothetical protein
VPVTYTITATGYTPTGVLPTDTVLVTPIPVSGLRLAASPQRVGTTPTPVTLSWAAVAATGFTLASTFGVIGQFPPNITQFATSVSTTVTFQVTASGFTAGAAEPTATVTVIAPKVEKDKDKDALEKQAKDHELPSLAGPPPGPGAPDPGLPGGSQQAFISADERPDVGAHLQPGGSGG